MTQNEKPTIGMLLDVEHFYGEHEGRVFPIIMTMLIALCPILFYVYFGLFVYIPIWVFIIVEIMFALYVVLTILGRQSYRLRMYKRQLFDSYTDAADLVNTKVIHPDGCLEYVNGQVAYLVAGYNGTTENVLARTAEMKKFLTALTGEYVFDLYIHNINTTPALTAYYGKVHNMGHTEVAANFIEIVDINKKRTEDKSKVQCIIFAIKGRKSDWKDIKAQIDAALLSESAKVFKTVYRVSDPETINAVINRDADTNVFIQDLLRIKYRTGEYSNSKVLVYDTDIDAVITVNDTKKKSKEVKDSKAAFHVSQKK